MPQRDLGSVLQYLTLWSPLSLKNILSFRKVSTSAQKLAVGYIWWTWISASLRGGWRWLKGRGTCLSPLGLHMYKSVKESLPMSPLFLQHTSIGKRLIVLDFPPTALQASLSIYICKSYEGLEFITFFYLILGRCLNSGLIFWSSNLQKASLFTALQHWRPHVKSRAHFQVSET